ncbi:MAG: SLC13 family permease [Vicinamibacterales bacterium]
MDPVVIAIFVLVYTGMLLGEFPGLALDRTGIALLGAIALVATDRLTVEAAAAAIDMPTMALLLGLMVISAQLRLGGFYTAVTRRVGRSAHGPAGLLALVVAAAGGLSAVLANDIVCLAMAPVIVEITARRGLDPVPFLLAVAAAANVGSAATLIGNPQNMLIGQALHLPFSRYLLDGGVPAAAGLVVVWAVVCAAWRHRWRRAIPPPPGALPAYDRRQTAKGLIVVAAVVLAFVLTSWPREAVALAGAGVLLASRRLASREMLALVDWPLLVLFAGLFVVNHALAASGALDVLIDGLQAGGVAIRSPATLFVTTAVLSNLVSNVPAVMLLLPAAVHPASGAVLALASTLAGNLVLVGSIANLIVVDQAARLGVPIGWRAHARLGIPITVITLALAAGWLALLGGG